MFERDRAGSNVGSFIARAAEMLRGRQSVYGIVREYFPRASDEEASFILWEKTGWPSFWHGDPETCLREQLATFQLARERGKDVCYGCGKIRVLHRDYIFCRRCYKRAEASDG